MKLVTRANQFSLKTDTVVTMIKTCTYREGRVVETLTTLNTKVTMHISNEFNADTCTLLYIWPNMPF